MAKKNETNQENHSETEAKKPKTKASSGKKATEAKAKPEAASESAQAAPKAAKAPKQPKQSGPKRAPLVERTYFAKPGQTPDRWRLVDATGIPLGRLSSLIAQMLMGKDKPSFTRFADTGDHVVVINAKNVKLTGNKWQDKLYKYHTNYPGGLKTFTAQEILEKHPERLIEWSVWGMLPKYKGHMVRHWHKKLRVFAGPDHNHQAQKPEPVKLPDLGARQ